MTIDEAIKHCKEQAEKVTCEECAKEHLQLVEWLEELKQLRQEREERINLCHKMVWGY